MLIAVLLVILDGCANGTLNDALVVTDRLANGLPAQYKARQQITFDASFESLQNDDFIAEIEHSAQACVPTGGEYVPGDMGEDGGSNTSAAARDVFGFNLNYFREITNPFTARWHLLPVYRQAIYPLLPMVYKPVLIYLMVISVLC